MLHFEFEFSGTALPFVPNALEQMSKPGCRHYHNWEHVNTVFEWLYKWNTPMPPHLELGVLFHDVVYDQFPEKEARSVDFMRGQLAAIPLSSSRFRNQMTWEAHKETVKMTANVIMATTDHQLSNHEHYTWPMIRADLADLSVPIRTIENYMKILSEAKALNAIDETTFAIGNIAFMTGLRNRVAHNRKTDDPEWKEFWDAVEDGIARTISISESLI